MEIRQMNIKLGKAERIHALESWYRIEADDGSTIAYVPDNVTAQQIVAMLKGKFSQTMD
jgi:hypothetical protein